MKREILDYFIGGGKVTLPGWTKTGYFQIINGELIYDGTTTLVSDGFDMERLQIYQEESQAMKWLEAGEKICLSWHSPDYYQYLLDGKIHDTNGNVRELKSCDPISGWQIWTPPTMTPVEAMGAMLKGEKVQKIRNAPGYMQIINGKVVDSKGRPCELAINTDEKYHIKPEPTKCPTCEQEVKK